MYSPTLEEFLKLAADGNLIPVSRRLLADIETPLSAYRKIRGPGEAFLFESVEGGEHLGRYSFVGCNPRTVIRQTADRVEIREDGKTQSVAMVTRAPDAAAGRVRKNPRPARVPGRPRSPGGAVGFIGYEFIHDGEPAAPPPPRDGVGP